MPKESSELFKSFKIKVETIDKIRKKQETLFNNSFIVKRDIEIVYSSLFLNVIINLESLIEELFIGLLSNLIKINKSNIKTRVKIKTTRIVREVVFNGKDYYSWLPYNYTLRVAKLYFSGGRPFTLLDEIEKDDLKKCLIIRNVIAHKSTSAINKFNLEVLGGIYLRPRDRNPSSFLRLQYSQNPSLNYYQYYVLKILSIVNKLCSKV